MHRAVRILRDGRRLLLLAVADFCLDVQLGGRRIISDPVEIARIQLRGEQDVYKRQARSYGIDGEIFAAELNFTALLSLQLPEKTYTPLPKYPAVTRDIAVVCDEAVTVAALSDCIRTAGGKLLRSCLLYTSSEISAQVLFK